MKSRTEPDICHAKSSMWRSSRCKISAHGPNWVITTRVVNIRNSEPDTNAPRTSRLLSFCQFSEAKIGSLLMASSSDSFHLLVANQGSRS